MASTLMARERLNGRKGKILGQGYYMVIFDDEVKVDEVLKARPWNVKGGLVLIQLWEPEFSVDGASYGIHPAWVELCNLPIHLWGFARSIFEAIGRVINFDESHKFTFRPHARACVLVDTNKELPKTLKIKIGEEVVHDIKVLVLGLPNTCFRCKQLGHFMKDCPYKPPNGKKQASSKNNLNKERATGDITMEDIGNPQEKSETIDVAKETIMESNEKEVESTKGHMNESHRAPTIAKAEGKGVKESSDAGKSGKEKITPRGREGIIKGKEVTGKNSPERVDMDRALVVFGSPWKRNTGDYLELAFSTKERPREEGNASPSFQKMRKKSKKSSSPKRGNHAQGCCKID